MHLLDLSETVKKGVQDAGLVGFRFNTVGVGDGITVGTEGMSYSLQSRDLIADSIETVMGAQWYDALIALPGCDKNMPGVVMAMGRLNRPSLMIYGGATKPGKSQLTGKPLDVVSACQSYGATGGMFTANTMAAAIEALGMSLPYSSSTPPMNPGKTQECQRAGAAILELIDKDIKPQDIMTRASFENAMTLVMALGGSTNSVLHLIAVAR
ncbi:hypothetical protein BSKO_06763 [Bryopsis sp. KO-2023]|nr:hypothetical protein BSKO_06763 [Bryopsis sp. KO-2023]